MRHSLGAAHVRLRRWRMRQRLTGHMGPLASLACEGGPRSAQMLTLDVDAFHVRVDQAGRRARF